MKVGATALNAPRAHLLPVALLAAAASLISCGPEERDRVDVEQSEEALNRMLHNMALDEANSPSKDYLRARFTEALLTVKRAEVNSPVIPVGGQIEVENDQHLTLFLYWLENGLKVDGFYLRYRDGITHEFPGHFTWDPSDEAAMKGTTFRFTWVPVGTAAAGVASRWDAVELERLPLERAEDWEVGLLYDQTKRTESVLLYVEEMSDQVPSDG